MYTLALSKTFTARHFLIGGDWGAENTPHAHSYRVEVRMQAEELDRHGYLADLEHVQQALDSCVACYAQRLLNDLPEFTGINPSIEHFAKRFHHQFINALGEVPCGLVKVRIWSNETAWVGYEDG
jgi:6-pyruvoyltetrahydropterin/6-carboxytetrahydropterin synthase